MYKYISYIWLMVAVLILQIFLLDNISIHLWLRPMIFPLVVLLLPMEWRTLWVMLIALFTGLVMDMSLGGAGIYVASLLPIALLRGTLMYLATNRVVESSDQTTLLSRLSLRQLMTYLALAMLLHHTLFFFLETLSLARFISLLATILFSTLLSMVVAWPIVRIFVGKVLGR